MRKILTLVATGLFVLALAPKTEALTLTFDTVFSGFTPSGSSPYLTANITDTAANTVQIELIASLDSTEFLSDIEFNLNPTLAATFPPSGAATLTMNYADADASAPAFSYGSDIDQADGDGIYDVLFSFATSGGAAQFTGTENVTFSLVYSGTGTFNAAAFNFLSTDAGGAGPFSGAAHVQGIPTNSTGGTCSGWVAPNNPNITETNSGPCSATTTTPTTTPTTPTTTTTTPTSPATPTGATPEPGMLTLLGMGLVMAGRRMRRQKA